MRKSILLFVIFVFLIFIKCDYKSSNIKTTNTEEINYFIDLVDYSLGNSIKMPSVLLSPKDTLFHSSYLINYEFSTNLPKGLSVIFSNTWIPFIETTEEAYLDLSYEDTIIITSDTLLLTSRPLLVNKDDNLFSYLNIYVIDEDNEILGKIPFDNKCEYPRKLVYCSEYKILYNHKQEKVNVKINKDQGESFRENLIFKKIK